MNEILEQTYYGNTVKDMAISAVIAIGAVIAGRVLYWLFNKIAKAISAKSKTKLDDIFIDMVEEPLSFIVVLAGLWYALNRLNFTEGGREFIGHATQFVVILTISWMLTRLFDALYQQYLVPLAEKSKTDLDDQVLPIVRRGTKLAVWVIGTIVALNNAGYDVGAALAGLGIGGLALAMAGKDTVANMFGGLTIFMDKPFKLNDRVKVAGFDGTITDIGLRSTRLTTLEGRVVTIPNAQFSESCVENVSDEPARKVVMTLGLTYDMSPGQMRDAMSILDEVAKSNPGVQEEHRVAFSGFGDFSMNILFIYWIEKDADILDTQTAVNLEILDRFNAKGLDMAFPTQTLYNKSA
jgi:MscS family membrane protein